MYSLAFSPLNHNVNSTPLVTPFLFCNLYVAQPKFYKSVIDNVIDGVRDVFAEEGVDEQVLKELKRVCRIAIWNTCLGSLSLLHFNLTLPEMVVCYVHLLQCRLDPDICHCLRSLFRELFFVSQWRILTTNNIHVSM